MRLYSRSTSANHSTCPMQFGKRPKSLNFHLQSKWGVCPYDIIGQSIFYVFRSVFPLPFRQKRRDWKQRYNERANQCPIPLARKRPSWYAHCHTDQRQIKWCWPKYKREDVIWSWQCFQLFQGFFVHSWYWDLEPQDNKYQSDLKKPKDRNSIT